jgi:hypothetical protein
MEISPMVADATAESQTDVVAILAVEAVHRSAVPTAAAAVVIAVVQEPVLPVAESAAD